jgi:hypothetical protein
MRDVAQWFAESLGERLADIEDATLVAALNAALELRVHAGYLREPRARRAVARVMKDEPDLVSRK